MKHTIPTIRPIVLMLYSLRIWLLCDYKLRYTAQVNKNSLLLVKYNVTWCTKFRICSSLHVLWNWGLLQYIILLHYFPYSREVSFTITSLAGAKMENGRANIWKWWTNYYEHDFERFDLKILILEDSLYVYIATDGGEFTMQQVWVLIVLWCLSTHQCNPFPYGLFHISSLYCEPTLLKMGQHEHHWEYQFKSITLQSEQENTMQFFNIPFLSGEYWSVYIMHGLMIWW